MNDRPASGPRSPDPFPALRVVALIAAILGVLVLAAAAFVLSYPGIHQLARTAGMSVTLARVFPVIFDALLIVSLAAVLSLHGAGWWRRGYAWLITLLLLAAMAAGGVLHTVHPDIPHRPAAITAAVLPWALLLIALSLLLSMLRQFRQRRPSRAAEPPAPAPAPAEPRTRLDDILSAGARRMVPTPLPPTPADTTVSSNGTGEKTSSAASADTSSADTKAEPADPDAAATQPVASDAAATQPVASDAAATEPADAADQTGAAAAEAEPAAKPDEKPQDEPESTRAPVPAPPPHFDRVRSMPTPPEADTDSDA